MNRWVEEGLDKSLGRQILPFDSNSLVLEIIRT
jgi:hypothetical protein